MRRLIPFFIAVACLLGLAAPSRATTAACTAGCVSFNSGSAFSGTAPSVTITGVTAGHSLHMWFCGSGPTAIASVTVGGSATGVTTGPPTPPSGGGNFCAMAVKPNASAGSNAVVWNTTGACTNCTQWVSEWAGEAASSSLTSSNGTFTLGTGSLPCGAITSNAGDTIDAMMFQPQNDAPTIPSGFSVSFNAGTSGFGVFQTGAASGSSNPTYTGAATSPDNYVMCGSFAQAGGGGGTITHLRLLMDVGQ